MPAPEPSAALYERVAEIFRSYPGSAVDLQTEFVDLLQIVQAVGDEKPSFFAMTDLRDRGRMFTEVLPAIREAGALCGLGDVAVHHRYRTLRIAEEQVAMEVSRHLAGDQMPILWITRRRELAEAYERGDSSVFDDTVLLERFASE